MGTPARDLGRPTFSRTDLDQSLGAIDKESTKKQSKVVRPRSKRRKTKFIVLAIIFILVGVGGYAGFRVLHASSQVLQGNIIQALVAPTKLQADANGRTNVLIFGTSEDDPNHGGADLTDSIMIMSIDQDKNTAYLLSIPRDLYVTYPESCDVGYEGKLNAVYHCGLEDNKNDKNAAAGVFKDEISKILGIDVQYYAHVNYTVVKDVVDAVGGVDITIASSDPRGILDRNFDWQCGYKCYYVKYANGPAHLDGIHALALARARNDAGGYGLPRGNFDRELNQQKILKAVQQKALTAGTLSNPIAALNIISSLGDNINTNFQTKELTTLINVAKNTKQSSMTTIDLDDASAPLVKTGTTASGSSIVEPVAGLEDYSQIQALLKQVLGGDPTPLEHATVSVYNASGIAGAASAESTSLKEAGFDVTNVATATTTSNKPYTIYDQTKADAAKPGTKAKLEKLLGVTSVPGAPAGITSSADFVVVLGTTPAASTSTTQ